MPEGDSVYRAARRLDAALSGRVLQSSDFRVPRFATLNLANYPVTSVVSRGKHLLIRVGNLSIHSHLSMEGHWDVYATGERWRAPAFKARCVLQNLDFQAVGFDLGFLRVIRTADEQEAVGHLGPDLLGASWDAAEAVRKLMQAPERPIGLSLLDQRLIAGLGNIYRAEVLFMAGVHPGTPTGTVPDLPRLVDLAHQVLHANKDRARRVTTPGNQREQYWVYGRAGRPCQRCGTRIAHGRMGEPREPVHALGLRSLAPTGHHAGFASADAARSASSSVSDVGSMLGGDSGRDAGTSAAATVHGGGLGSVQSAIPGAAPGAVLNERDIYYCPHCQPSGEGSAMDARAG